MADPLAGVQFTVGNAFDDGGVLLEIDRDPIAEGEAVAHRRLYFALPCRHGEWRLLGADPFEPNYHRYICARGCGSRLKVRLTPDPSSVD